MFERLGSRGAVALSQLLIAGGVVAGGVGVGVGLQQGGVIGNGDETVEVALDSVPTYECPGVGETGELHRGDRVLATGKDDPGDFVEVRDPSDLGDRVWVNARYLVPDADLSGLDVRECGGSEEVAAPTTLPGTPESLPPGVTTTTKKAGGGGPAPAPGPAPDTTGPAISGVSATPNEIWEQHATLCGTAARQSTINAGASDPSGVASLTASWAFASVNETKNVPAQFGPFAYHTIATNTQVNVTITITARDTRGNTSTATTTVLLHSADQCFG